MHTLCCLLSAAVALQVLENLLGDEMWPRASNLVSREDLRICSADLAAVPFFGQNCKCLVQFRSLLEIRLFLPQDCFYHKHLQTTAVKCYPGNYLQYI